MNSINWPASRIWVFIAQLGEHCSTNAEATGSYPVEAPKNLFFGLFSQLLKLRFTAMVTYSFHKNNLLQKRGGRRIRQLMWPRPQKNNPYLYYSQLSANGHSRKRTALTTEPFPIPRFTSQSNSAFTHFGKRTLSGKRTRTLLKMKIGFFFSLRSLVSGHPRYNN